MEPRVIRGKVRKLGDHVNTDVISPARWMREGLEVLRLHALEAIREDFYREVHPGDIVVAGRNFGCGSHREQAATIMKFLGVAAIVADSVARLYRRNCIAFGIPVFGIPGASRTFEEGDVMEISMGEGDIFLRNLTRSGELRSPPLPDTMAEVLLAGGVYPLLKRKIDQGL